MKIGIDIDDTITDSYDIITASYAYCTKSSQKLFINNKLSYLDLEKKYPNFKDYTIKSFSKIMPYAKVKYQAKEVIDKLHEMGYIIELVSARNTTEYEDPYGITYDYLKKHNIYFDNLTVSVTNKGKFCKENNIKFLIDDSIDNLNNAKSYGIKPIIFNNVFNENNVSFTRVNSWIDILNLFNHI
ncbi:MAG: hypothetical protein OSJ65_07030 [Bacilli bacterium]|nr:hypothetical protein [Bacilli bacterium]